MFEDRIAALNKEETEMPLPYEKRIYTVDEIQDILGIGRNAAYNLVKSGVFHSVRIGEISAYQKRALMNGLIVR